MKIIKTDLESVVILESRIFNDDRVFFESFNAKTFQKLVINVNFV